MTDDVAAGFDAAGFDDMVGGDGENLALVDRLRRDDTRFAAEGGGLFDDDGDGFGRVGFLLCRHVSRLNHCDEN